MRKKEILFIHPSLISGGAERVIVTLMNHLDREKFDISLVLFKREGEYLSHLSSDIRVIELNISQARYALPEIFKLIKRQKPDIVFTSLGHINMLLAAFRKFFPKEMKFVARESNTVSQNNKRDKYPMINEILYKRFYKNFDLIVTQAKSMKEDLEQNYNVPSSKMKIIYNPVHSRFILESAKAFEADFPKDKFNLLAVGRLEEQKGFDMLLQVLSKLDDSYHLTIVGEGSKREELEALIESLDLAHKVSLLGLKSNPYPYMKEADLFVLSSRYEGLPNVVLEANVCGTPVVAFNSSGGTGEIVRDGINGFLVKPFDLDAFADKIKEARAYDFDRETISQNTIKAFGIQEIIKQYEELFIA